jgi:hypothetical protein
VDKTSGGRLELRAYAGRFVCELNPLHALHRQCFSLLAEESVDLRSTDSRGRLSPHEHFNCSTEGGALQKLGFANLGENA